MVATMSIQQTTSPSKRILHDETLPHWRTPGGSARGRNRVRPLGDRSWTAVQRYLDSHMGGAIRLEEMARTAGVSRFHFARMFRVRVGTSPMEYVIARRIEMAKERLARADASISTVALDLGFFDQSHFCRTFCRRVGVTPGQYRARAASQDTDA